MGHPSSCRWMRCFPSFYYACRGECSAVLGDRVLLPGLIVVLLADGLWDAWLCSFEGLEVSHPFSKSIRQGSMESTHGFCVKLDDCIVLLQHRNSTMRNWISMDKLLGKAAKLKDRNPWWGSAIFCRFHRYLSKGGQGESNLSLITYFYLVYIYYFVF